MNINELFKIAVDKEASDLHLVADMPPAIRIHGELNFIEGQKAISVAEIEKMVFSILTAEEKAVFLVHKDLDFGYEADGNRFRVNIHYEKKHIGLVARVINDHIPSIGELEMPPVVYRLLDLKQGLILVTGPTGCGKSTSLAAMVDYINENFFCHIITLEDPIEYIFKPKKAVIRQRQLGADMENFPAGLKHALRQDPNVVMVGEMRDLETIATAITLAETGHLVLATLHTYSASQTIDRIIDTFPSHQQNQIRMQLSTTLAGIVSQRLLTRVDGGRVAAREILINNSAVANLIRENKNAQIKTAMEIAGKEGMISMDRDIRGLYEKKLISKETAQSYMENPSLIK